MIRLSKAAERDHFDHGWLDPIKKEFSLSDTTLGLISGFGFVAVYSTLGVIVGRIGDRVHRVGLLGIAFAFWSVMTALTSQAGGVVQDCALCARCPT